MSGDFTATLPRKRMGAGALLSDGQESEAGERLSDLLARRIAAAVRARAGGTTAYLEDGRSSWSG
jgi:hypothetical protein